MHVAYIVVAIVVVLVFLCFRLTAFHAQHVEKQAKFYMDTIPKSLDEVHELIFQADLMDQYGPDWDMIRREHEIRSAEALPEPPDWRIVRKKYGRLYKQIVLMRSKVETSILFMHCFECFEPGAKIHDELLRIQVAFHTDYLTPAEVRMRIYNLVPEDWVLSDVYCVTAETPYSRD